jgi:hypothetical protein
VGNYVSSHSGTVTPSGGKYVISLPGATLEVNRFEHGRLFDGANFYQIESNTATTVTVLPGTYPPQENVDVTLWDDDTQTMPEMPDLGLMEQAYREAYIYPVLDGGGDLNNNKANVAFQLNMDWDDNVFLAQIQAPNGLESNGNRSVPFWIGYVQSAYQPNTENDYDPNSGVGRCGGTPSVPPKKGSLVFLETAKDFAREVQFPDPRVLVQRVVAHEIAHQFNVAEEQGEPPSIMHSASLGDPNSPKGSRFNESQQSTLRHRQNSPGSVGP